jgi:hypothetical protein
MLTPVMILFCLVPQTVQTPRTPVVLPVTSNNALYQRIILHHCTAQDLAPFLGIQFFPARSLPALSLGHGGGLSGPGVIGSGMMGPGNAQRSLRPPGIDNLIALDNATLLVQGDPADIDELQELIRCLDVPIPSVTFKVEIVRIIGSGKKARQIPFGTTATGKAGQSVKLTNRLIGGAAQLSQLQGTVKATTLEKDRFEIDGQWEVSLPLQASGKEPFLRLEKTLECKRQVRTGERILMEYLTFSEEQGAAKGGEEVFFYLTVTSTIEN